MAKLLVSHTAFEVSTEAIQVLETMSLRKIIQLSTTLETLKFMKFMREQVKFKEL